jgi:hypothetical protein
MPNYVGGLLRTYPVSIDVATPVVTAPIIRAPHPGVTEILTLPSTGGAACIGVWLVVFIPTLCQDTLHFNHQYQIPFTKRNSAATHGVFLKLAKKVISQHPK